jgi:hypothetical protein
VWRFIHHNDRPNKGLPTLIRFSLVMFEFLAVQLWRIHRFDGVFIR